MPFILLTLLLITIHSVHSQEPDFYVQSSRQKCVIIEKHQKDSTYWYLDPSLQPDLYEADYGRKKNIIHFITPEKELKIKLKKGESIDFGVVWNQDTCYQRFISPLPKQQFESIASLSDTIPFILTEHNNIILKALLNGQDTLNLMFDAGSDGISITREAIQHKTHLLPLDDSTNWTLIPHKNQLTIGNTHWKDQPIRASRLSGQGSDGNVGWKLFQNNYIEIDYDKKYFILHQTLPSSSKRMKSIPLLCRLGLLGIMAQLNLNGKRMKQFFNYDNGYQRAVFLDRDLLNIANVLSQLTILKETNLRDGNGNTVTTQIVMGNGLKIGPFLIKNIPAQLLTNMENPAGRPTHFIGNELLKRFNTILDLKNFRLYLTPNTLFNEDYIDLK